MAVEGAARAAGAQTRQQVDSRQAHCGGPAGAPRGAAPRPKKNRNVGFQRYDFVLGVSYQFWYQKRPNRNVAAITFINNLILFDYTCQRYDFIVFVQKPSGNHQIRNRNVGSQRYDLGAAVSPRQRWALCAPVRPLPEAPPGQNKCRSRAPALNHPSLRGAWAPGEGAGGPQRWGSAIQSSRPRGEGGMPWH